MKGMEIHSSILAWRMSWTEEPDGLQSMVLQRVRHNLVTKPPPPYKDLANVAQNHVVLLILCLVDISIPRYYLIAYPFRFLIFNSRISRLSELNCISQKFIT